MPESNLLSLGTELVKATLSEAIQESVKDWLNDKVRVRRAIQETAFAFSSRLPGAENALKVWVRTDAFRSNMEDLGTGRAIPEQFAIVNDFLAVTGIGFGSAQSAVVHELLTRFYEVVREDLVSSRGGLILVDNRAGELLRQIREFRSDLAAQAAPSSTQIGIQRVSAEFVNDVAQKQGWGGGLGFGAGLQVNLELPPAVEKIAKRDETVSAVRDLLQTAAWYAMYGGSGSGKTQLAILIAQAFAGPRVWIRLGGPPAAAGLVLESALIQLAARQPRQSTQQWCEAACLALGSGGIMVLDDLPRTQGDGMLDEQLTALCTACTNTGVRLVTTSHSPLAIGLTAAVGCRVYEESAPRFREDEIRELFRAYGAPESFLTPNWLGFVNNAAKRHPLLLVEAVRYLQSRGWATDDTSLDDLLRGTFASALDLPTVERIRKTVPQDTTREFLYRLKLIGWPFSLAEVQRVSTVPPPVKLPLEHLASVVGLWVQEDGAREYTVSPLLSRLGNDNLPNELQQAIHNSLARGILEKHRLGPLEATQAVNHFVAGGDVNNAAVVLLMAWQGMVAVTDLNDPFALTLVWAGIPLPCKIDLEKRIYLRALQVILGSRLGRDHRFESDDLGRLLEEGESDEDCQLVIAVVGMMLATHRGEREPDLAIRSVRKGISASRRVEAPIAINAELDLHTGLLTALWMIVAWLQTDAQYEQWFAAVRDLTPDEVRAWAEIRLAGQASESVCGGLWTRTADLPAPGRDWTSVLERLEHLKAWAHSAGVPPLATAALRSQIIVVADGQRELAKAEKIAREGMDGLSELPQSKFAIAETIARQHYYFGDPADAIRWFDCALESREAAEPAALVGTLVRAGVAAHRFDADLACRYLKDGVVVAASSRVGVLSRVTVQGELGILLWNAGKSREAYEVWKPAAQELLATRQDTREWKTLFQLFGNCTGHFLLTKSGRVVDDKEMTAPFSGILLREIAAIDELHKPERDWFLPVQMAMLAESVGAYDDAVDWARRTTVGSGAPSVGAEMLLAGFLTAGKLAETHYEEIIRAADIGDLDETRDPEGSAQLDPEGAAHRAARYAARLDLVALAIEVARLGLSSRPLASTLARRAAELIHECAVRHSGSHFWSGASDVFEALQNRGVSAGELWKKAAEARKNGNNAVQVMYGIAATVVAGPKDAMIIQLTIAPWVEQLFSPTLYHVTMANFVPEYWQWALDKYTMSFSMLKNTRLAFSEAEALDDRLKVRAVLNAAAFSLAVRVPVEIKNWLSNSTK